MPGNKVGHRIGTPLLLSNTGEPVQPNAQAPVVAPIPKPNTNSNLVGFSRSRVYSIEVPVVRTHNNQSTNAKRPNRQLNENKEDSFDEYAAQIDLDNPVKKRKCTPQEIADKRRQALKRLENTKKARK